MHARLWKIILNKHIARAETTKERLFKNLERDVDLWAGWLQDHDGMVKQEGNSPSLEVEGVNIQPRALATAIERRETILTSLFGLSKGKEVSRLGLTY